MDFVQCISSAYPLDPTDPLHRQTERFCWLSQPFGLRQVDFRKSLHGLRDHLSKECSPALADLFRR
jgi:hypothetical protein